MRRARVQSLKGAAIAFVLSLLLATTLCWPITSQSGVLNLAGPVVSYFCPETGQLARPTYSSRTARQFAMEACLDRNGEKIFDREVHNAIFRTVLAFWTLALFACFYPIFHALLVHGRSFSR
ncbi:MAG: hypothetical protein ABWZ80_07330 [Beijerinckiaceae bacterium]